MTENIITEKMKRSIYLDYPDYRDNPFTTSNKFGVYIPKLNDRVNEMIERHEEKLTRRAQLNSSKKAALMASQQPQQDNIFANSIRTGPEPHFDQQHQTEPDHLHYSEVEPQAAHDHRFRIRRSNSRCDSAYSKDTHTLKKRFHGNRYGYYTNLPYSMVGSSFAGSRFYYDVAARSISNAPQLGRPCSKAQGRKFEDELLVDERTGQKNNPRTVGPVVNNLLRDASVRKSQSIQEGILKLKQQGCLNVPCERIKVNKQHPEKGYVYNDYHTKQSKNGYEVSSGGRPYI